MEEKRLVVFQNKKIRRTWFENEWYFSVIDVVEVLTDSVNPRDYWFKMKKRVKTEDQLELSTICRQLKIESSDNKRYKTDCANTENMFRIIQSIPSPKAEPFKQWLAKVGYERIQEIENPEIANERIKEIYRKKGYSENWIEKRIRGIAVRDELTGEWKKRGVKEQLEFAILTAEISKATFGMTPSEYKDFKSLTNPKDNLRDHMTDLELIFTMLGEASTTEIARKKDAIGFDENEKAAKEGGKIAGDARIALEKKTGEKVSIKDNYKEIPESKKKALTKSKK
jgi:DNA-damage-inducible protein D